jgi:cystathionine beta-synthase
LQSADALMVVQDGDPVGVLTRHDLLGFLTR